MAVGHFISDNYINTPIVSNFAAAQNFYTGDGTGPQANTTGFSAWVVVNATYPISNPTNDVQLLFGKTNHNTNKIGWSFVQFQGELTFCIGGGFVRNDGLFDSQYNAISASAAEVGKLQVIHGVIRNGVIYMYRNGILSYSTGFAITASMSSFISCTKGLAIGSYAFQDPSVKFYPYQGGIATCGISSIGLTDDQVETHYQAILNNIYAQAPSTTNLFRASDAGATWTDTVGGLVATNASTTTVASTLIPFYRRYRAADRVIDSDPILPPLPNAKVGWPGDSRMIGGTPHNSVRLGCYNMVINDPRLSGVTFVGTVFNASFPYGFYDGYGGTSFNDFLTGQNGPTNPTVYMAANNPDVIVMLLGVNNLDVESSYQNDFINLVKAYVAIKPTLRFVFIEENNAKFNGTTRDSEMQAQNNWRWRQGFVQLSQLGIKFIRVPVYNLLTPGTDDFLDDPPFRVHPTEQGFQKMNQYVDNNNKGNGVAKGLLLALGYT